MWIRVGERIFNTERIIEVGRNGKDVYVTIGVSTGDESGYTILGGSEADAVFDFFNRMATTIYPNPAPTP